MGVDNAGTASTRSEDAPCLVLKRGEGDENICRTWQWWREKWCLIIQTKTSCNVRALMTSLLHQRQGLCGVNVGPNYFTIILQSSVGTLEGHSEVGVYLASFCVPN